MRCFLLTCALIAAAAADVSHLSGYNYGAGVGSSNLGVLGGFASLGGSSGGNGVHYTSSSGNNGFVQFGSGGGGGGGGGGGFVAQHSAPVQTEFTKEFYTFEAPEEEFIDAENLQRTAESIKKNLQVVFIKGPEQRGLEHAAVNLARSAVESKTAIYVLQKQPDVGHLANSLNLLHTHNAHRPEVHFVKYRTDADAANAQNAIRSQYDQLGGSSEHKHGGVAPVLNFASAPVYHQSGSNNVGFAVPDGAASGSSGVVDNVGGGFVSVGGVGGVGGGVSNSYIAPAQVYLPSAKH